MTEPIKRPLISILIPCKNAAHYLEECLSSITQQSYTNWESIIVDDNSTDNSLEILKNWGKHHERFKICKNGGYGIISALQTAFAISKGTLITRMDADDIMTANKLEKMASQLIQHGHRHVATGTVQYFREDKPLGTGYKRYAEWLNTMSQSGSNFGAIYKECVIPSPCWMLYRKDLQAIGAFQPNIYPEDYDLVFRMYKENLQVIPCSDEVLHLWRDHSDRASRNDSNYRDNRFLDLKIQYFIDLDYRQEIPLFVWGAGAKAKMIAQTLIERAINFYWITDNEKKIGHNIYDVILQSPSSLNKQTKAQIILTMANVKEQLKVKERIHKISNRTDCQSYWFC